MWIRPEWLLIEAVRASDRSATNWSSRLRPSELCYYLGIHSQKNFQIPIANFQLSRKFPIYELSIENGTWEIFRRLETPYEADE
jgi:hypothetical protein